MEKLIIDPELESETKAESILFPRVEKWSSRFWKLLWHKMIDREILADYFVHPIKEEMINK